MWKSPRHRGGGHPFDRAGGQAAFELSHAQQDLQTMTGKRDANAAVVIRIGRRLDEPLGLEALDERRGGRPRHAQRARHVARPGPVRPPQIHRRHHGVGPLRQPEALVGAIAGALDGLPSRDHGVGEL